MIAYQQIGVIVTAFLIGGTSNPLYSLLIGHYVDLETGQSCGIHDAIDSLAKQVNAARANNQDSYCFGFRYWKRRTTRPLLTAPGAEVHFCRKAQDAVRHGINKSARIVTWGRRISKEIQALSQDSGAPIHCMEDGFLRSVGLGSDLVPPASLVLDASGIYFDATTTSDLERLLDNHVFDPALRDQATRLRQRLVDEGFSKYNLGHAQTLTIHDASGKPVVLVPGQVEDDASIEFGCADLRSNEALLKAVRTAMPEAWILYKPHPDVVAGNRRGETTNERLLDLCDQLVMDCDIVSCLELVDEVHTLTSLTGFEALLRGIPVTTYGRPFYAGWGLTRDRLDFPRRHRVLHLNELVAGTLILYPSYYDWRSGVFTTPERTLDRLRDERVAATVRPKPRHPYLERQIRKLGYLVRGLAPR